jgi:RNA polymerase sigma-70 factor (ECF subfamily)
MMDDQSDQWLIERAVAGDGPAFARLLERHYGFIYRVAFKWCGARADAEDIAQDVAIKLGQAIRNFKGDAAFTSWLYRITLNAVRDFQRAQATRIERTAAMALVTPQVEEPDQDVGLVQDQLWQAVRSLPDKQRDAMLLVFAEDLSHGAAAKIMECAESTVSWHIHEAKKKLKELL